MGNWNKIIADPRHPDGFFYSCESGHQWFVTFKERDNVETVNCPDCASQVQTPPDVSGEGQAD